jgi:flagellar motor switch protein FliG
MVDEAERKAVTRTRRRRDAAQKEGLTGARKAAILLISLDQELAVKVLSLMERDTIETLSMEIAKLEEISRDERDAVIEEFYHLHLAHQYVEHGGVAYARALLERVLPADEVARIIETIEQSMKMAPFGFLQRAEPENLLTFLQDEHPQTIALILAHIAPSQAAGVLAGLPVKKQLEVVKRLATMEHTSPEVISQVEKALEKKLAAIVTEELREAGGVEAVAEILNLTDRATERGILESLEEEDPDLADQIRRLMFVFEDILLVNDRGVQSLLKEIDQEQLALALKTATLELKEKFFKNMSKRAVELIKEEMEYMGPVRLADVEAAQQQIVDIVRKLEEQGEVIIQGRGAEEEVIV